MYKYFLVIGCIFWMNVIKAQELRSRVTVITTRVSNNINKTPNMNKSGTKLFSPHSVRKLQSTPTSASALNEFSLNRHVEFFSLVVQSKAI
jgi:hypothetical protein